MIKAALHNFRLNLDKENYLSKHDIVFQSPPEQGYEGLIAGNGDTGIIAWTPSPGDKLHFQINKANTWDDGLDESFGAWDDGNHSNSYTSLRHCGELTVELGLPVFDWNYLTDFDGRMSLNNADISFKSKSCFGEVNCRNFVSHDHNVFAIKYNDQLTESVTRSIKLARWGTRVFEHWYVMLNRDQFAGPEGAISGCDGDEIWIEQPLRRLKFAMALKIVGNGFCSKIFSSRQAGFEYSAGKTCSFTAYISVVTSEESDAPLAKARQNVRDAACAGFDEIFNVHKKNWSKFWSKSFVSIPDEFLENLWYINLYQIGSSAKGDYPPHFINSIWGWSRDHRPWNHYYHWNQQAYTWPLCASGHPELIEPYAKWRRSCLDIAVKDARAVHNCSGAFYSDVSNRRGYQDVIDPNDYLTSVEDKWLKTYVVSVVHNISCGAQIAHDLYRHYQYTHDEDFFSKYTYPIFVEWVKFILDYVKKDTNGVYHVPKADPYETTELHCFDSTNNLAYIRLLVPEFIRIAREKKTDIELADRAEELVNNLADYVRAHLPEDFKGGAAPGSEVVTGGTLLETMKPIFYGAHDKRAKFNSFLKTTAMSPIFPTGLVSLNTKNSNPQEFELFKNTTNSIMPPAGESVIEDTGIIPGIMSRIRLGQKEYVYKELLDHVDSYQYYPQGLWCYFPRDGSIVDNDEGYVVKHSSVKRTPAISDHTTFGHTNRVKVWGKDEYIDLPSKHFAHFALEPGSIFQTAVNELLLQSLQGKIRVFPATPDDWDCRFILHAEGGFLVTSECKKSKALYILIESEIGENCCVINPWGNNTQVIISDVCDPANPVLIQKLTVDDQQIVFATTQGGIYLIENMQMPVSSFETLAITASANQAYKKHKNCRAVLGKPRQF